MQKTAYEVRVSDWSSDVCSSDLRSQQHGKLFCHVVGVAKRVRLERTVRPACHYARSAMSNTARAIQPKRTSARPRNARTRNGKEVRSEEHTSELQSLMRISYAVFCLKKKNKKRQSKTQQQTQHIDSI